MIMEDTTLEDIILQSLITNEGFTRKAIPYIKEEYFTENKNRCIFRCLDRYFKNNSQLPQKAILTIEVTEDSKISHGEIPLALSTINNIYNNEAISDEKWLLDNAEKWCQDRDMYLSIIKAISIYDGTDKTLHPAAIPRNDERLISRIVQNRYWFRLAR